ncbi:hypothetical protein AC1031_018693 [Aphanomyces cochlioides]|nr:hypothetical protein AC1031_018693 [Aphanomyces cochlioides]
MEVAQHKLKELYKVHDHYFSADKQEKKVQTSALKQFNVNTLTQLKLQAMADEICALIDEIHIGNNRHMKATASYIKGKALDAFPEYSASSEVLLSQAAKLDPCNLDVWVSLGNCFWKKGDMQSAKNCFENCLDFGPSKQALRCLSMLLRRMGTKPEEMSRNIKTSIAHAKQALSMDIEDGESWCKCTQVANGTKISPDVMGNALLALFFTSSHSPVDLDRSLAAYARAEATGAAGNPDLHFNRGNVHNECRSSLLVFVGVPLQRRIRISREELLQSTCIGSLSSSHEYRRQYSSVDFTCFQFDSPKGSSEKLPSCSFSIESSK